MRPWIEKPETQNRRLEPTGLAKPGKSRGLTGTGPGLAHQDAAGRVFGQFWNRTEPFFRSEPGPLPGYPDPLRTLLPGHKFTIAISQPQITCIWVLIKLISISDTKF